jgi:hypothetical protein
VIEVTRRRGIAAFALAAALAAAFAPAAPAPPQPDPGGQEAPASQQVCVVPNVKRKTLVDALVALTNARCAAGSVRYRYSKVRRDRVVSQKPRAGTRLRGGAKVSLVVSRGRRR